MVLKQTSKTKTHGTEKKFHKKWQSSEKKSQAYGKNDEKWQTSETLSKASTKRQYKRVKKWQKVTNY